MLSFLSDSNNYEPCFNSDTFVYFCVDVEAVVS